MRELLYKKHKLIGNKGFSLVELIIVIAIMAVLMAVLAPQLIKYVEKSRTQTDDTAASEILNAVKVALTDEAIYSGIVGGEHVTWVGSSGLLSNDAATALQTLINNELTSTVGTPGIAKSKTRKAQTYTITIALPASGIPTVTGGWGNTPAT